MKNIHILKTDQPSRLGYISESKTYHLYNNDVFLDELANAINIYITSLEDIKEDELCIDGTTIGYYALDDDGCPILKDSKNKTAYSFSLAPHAKKIILTTDPTLIKDGVQAIDDEFLEWFVKNSSCEFVKITIDKVRQDKEFNDISHWNIYEYKIIIPQELFLTKH